MLVAVLLDGARGAVLGLTLLVLGWTVAGLLHHQHRARLVRRRRVEVARACAALAAQLRIGQVAERGPGRRGGGPSGAARGP